MCGIALLSLFIPWIVGICVCLWRYFGTLWDKVAKWFKLKKNEREMQKFIDEYYHWYTTEEIAILQASIYDSKYKRSQIFNINDLKIWKAFI